MSYQLFQWLPLHTEQKQCLSQQLKTSHDHLPLSELITGHFPRWSHHFSSLASLLHLLSVPCAWSTLPRKSYGSFLPFLGLCLRVFLLGKLCWTTLCKLVISVPHPPTASVMRYHRGASVSGTMFLGPFHRPVNWKWGLGPDTCITKPCSGSDSVQA